MFDTHIHTNNSPDSNQSIDEVCIAAIERGLSSVSICDHAEVSLFDRWDFFNLIKSSIADTKKAQEKYQGRLKIFQGIEISEFFWDSTKVDGFLSLGNYDVILGSIHRVDCEGFNDSFSRVNMSDMPEELLYNFLNLYFRDMKTMIENYDFDILSHLTVPLRYLNGKYNRDIDIFEFSVTADIRTPFFTSYFPPLLC